MTLNSYKGMAERIVRVAQAENLTLRETAQRFVMRRSSFVGTAKTVADEIERWFLAGAVDGFILHSNGTDFDRFATDVVPLLQERGLFRRDYEHDTLRGHLGIPVPANRHTVARQAIGLAAE